MPRDADEDGDDLIPCTECFNRIVYEPYGEHCQPQPPGKARGTRCNDCAKRHRACNKIPEAAYAAVRGVLEMRQQLWNGDIREAEFRAAHEDARKAVNSARRAEWPTQPTAAPTAAAPAAALVVAVDNAQQRENMNDRAPVNENLDIDSMGVAATLHEILRTLIRIDRRMENLEARF